ncbi:AsmA family protein [Nitrosomonas sp. JL21]|uniref:AsmA family protein n=1 Tax=Nitrosomonas sp. JL21 TaxID=153949 RepID=UPI001367BE68|nr:AsmA family protein [Nitrosomonas sp. JL21]MBL8497443.1 AsmA family protein [Nitrosomonas sp.]MXS78674.1 AsmA family protein [Nitrosomonas sp. JL21]
MKILKFIVIILMIGTLILIGGHYLLTSKWSRDLLAQQISERIDRTLTINGDLTIDWSMVPRIRIQRITLANVPSSPSPYMAEIDELGMSLDVLEILKGHIVIADIALIHPKLVLEKYSATENNWTFPFMNQEFEKDIMPVDVERLRIEQGTALFKDEKDTAIEARIDTRETLQHGADNLHVKATGTIKGDQFNLTINSGPLVALREAKQEFPLSAALQAGSTIIKAAGTARQPLKLKDMNLEFSVRGSNPAHLSKISGIPLPNLPPYHMKGNVSDREKEWEIKNLIGKIGDSDLKGKISIDLSGTQPFVKADLLSKKIDLDDFGPMLGIAPDTGPGETASAAQKREAKKQAVSEFSLPTKPIDFKKLENIHVDIKLTSSAIQTDLPIDNLTTHLIVQNGRLTLSPLDFGVAHGKVISRVEIDANAKPVQTKIDTEIHHLRLKEILKRWDISSESAGIIGGKAIYWLKGNSLADMFSSADGGMLMLMTGGKLDDLLVELSGLDLGEALVALFDKESNTEINCAFLDLPTKNGLITISKLIIDTDDTIFLGSGSINLKQEQLDMVIDPHPKDLSVFSARAPLHIEGTFKKPTFTPGATALIRGAVSLALLPSAPVVSLYALMQKENDGKRPINAHCATLEKHVKKDTAQENKEKNKKETKK